VSIWWSVHPTHRWVFLALSLSGWPFSKRRYLRAAAALFGWELSLCLWAPNEKERDAIMEPKP
jgi:hypothetical protein